MVKNLVIISIFFSGCIFASSEYDASAQQVKGILADKNSAAVCSKPKGVVFVLGKEQEEKVEKRSEEQEKKVKKEDERLPKKFELLRKKLEGKAIDIRKDIKAEENAKFLADLIDFDRKKRKIYREEARLRGEPVEDSLNVSRESLPGFVSHDNDAIDIAGFAKSIYSGASLLGNRSQNDRKSKRNNYDTSQLLPDAHQSNNDDDDDQTCAHLEGQRSDSVESYHSLSDSQENQFNTTTQYAYSNGVDNRMLPDDCLQHFGSYAQSNNTAAASSTSNDFVSVKHQGVSCKAYEVQSDSAKTLSTMFVSQNDDKNNIKDDNIDMSPSNASFASEGGELPQPVVVCHHESDKEEATSCSSLKKMLLTILCCQCNC